MAGRDDEAVAAYRKVLELKPDFSDYGEYLKLAIVYTDQKKTDMANAAFQQFAERASSFFTSLSCRLRGAAQAGGRGLRRRARQLPGSCRRNWGAQNRARLPGNSCCHSPPCPSSWGKGPSALSFVQQQKLDDEQLRTLAFLQTLAGNTSAAQQSLQRYATSHPWIAPRAIEIDQAYADVSAAVQRGDGQAALDRAATIPDFQEPYLLFLKARSHLLINDYSPAEQEFRSILRVERSVANSRALVERFPLPGVLSHYYLGQLYERTGKRDKAIDEFQEFLSHFSNSQTRLTQVGDARTALKQLMQ